MNITERVARAIFEHEPTETSEEAATAAINTFLAAAAEQGWHMRPDEPTKEMALTASQSGYVSRAHRAILCYRSMLDAAPKFEVGDG